MLAARADMERVSDIDRAESEAGPLPLPTTHEDIMSGGWEGEPAGADFAYELRHPAMTASER
ncbi:MAG: hypothetical protein QOH81_2391 [Sphingomonadales bacterium]|jgi:hypothetical protein|nr:hypothetical protein [Sphingomonadales bacterium]